MQPTRRQFLGLGLKAGAGLGLITAAPGIVLAESRRPVITSGVMSGDVGTDRAIIWSRADRPSRMLLDIADNAAFNNARTLQGPTALPTSGLTAKLDVTGLADLPEVFYRVRFAALGDDRAVSEPVIGRLVMPGRSRRSVRFVWSGDTVGQGWGIDESRIEDLCICRHGWQHRVYLLRGIRLRDFGRLGLIDDRDSYGAECRHSRYLL